MCSWSQKGRCEFETCTESLAPGVVLGVYTPQGWLEPQNAEDTIDTLNFFRLLPNSVHWLGSEVSALRGDLICFCILLHLQSEVYSCFVLGNGTETWLAGLWIFFST